MTSLSSNIYIILETLFVMNAFTEEVDFHYVLENVRAIYYAYTEECVQRFIMLL